MARGGRAAARGGRRPKNAPAPRGARPPPPARPPALWRSLRLARKKPLELLPAAAFRELVRGAAALRAGFGVQGAAVAALRAGCERQLLALLQDWGLCALHARRVTVRAADVSLVRCLQVRRA